MRAKCKVEGRVSRTELKKKMKQGHEDGKWKKVWGHGGRKRCYKNKKRKKVCRKKLKRDKSENKKGKKEDRDAEES